MKIATIMMVAGTVLLLSALPSMAAPTADDSQKSTTAAVSSMPDGTEVTITGTVENFDSRHPFTLRDSSGTIKVDLSSAKPIVLKDGEKVTVTGDVSKSLLGTNINATDVNIDSENVAPAPAPSTSANP
jgi:uncharacterized protein YdeI (BOF family)